MAGAIFGDVGLSVFDVGMPLFVAGAVFGDVAASLCMAGAIFGQIWVDSRRATCGNLHTKCISKARKVTSANGRVRDEQFMFGSWSNRPPV